ncbi:hypothetical protein E2C01_052556 [Portunus trituberculatus]|uniref:Uncharacterized protein n=1 Tax=Portunus trituberculatus TaxID=210409 RepID=A0A5B7GE21_PORTR|nr:hypothetical protein [Portunus trituberculatus]
MSATSSPDRHHTSCSPPRSFGRSPGTRSVCRQETHARSPGRSVSPARGVVPSSDQLMEMFRQLQALLRTVGGGVQDARPSLTSSRPVELGREDLGQGDSESLHSLVLPQSFPEDDYMSDRALSRSSCLPEDPSPDTEQGMAFDWV